ncbi:methyltransferase, TIGR04325 family [Methylocella sp.]|uniref:methyltransferase, TIGR04325 family n=1 Tax=Methylocella sp. TaxID=1978226 RepID=UPI0035B323C8
MSFNVLAKKALGATGVGAALRRAPFAEAAYRRYALGRRDHPGLYYGVYASYDEALADIPADRREGWDNDAAAELWVGNLGYLQTASYPVMMWLNILLREGAALVDYGGSVGLAYYAYRRFFGPPQGVDWTVVEVPAIARQGAAMALDEKAALRFVEDPAQAPAPDFLLSAGAIQYMRDGAALLERFKGRPRHVLLNKLPLTEGPGFFTLQNFGVGVSPYEIYNEDEFLGYFAARGYGVRDRWEVHELECAIPFHPERHVKSFTGILFEADDA